MCFNLQDFKLITSDPTASLSSPCSILDSQFLGLNMSIKSPPTARRVFFPVTPEFLDPKKFLGTGICLTSPRLQVRVGSTGQRLYRQILPKSFFDLKFLGSEMPCTGSNPEDPRVRQRASLVRRSRCCSSCLICRVLTANWIYRSPYGVRPL